MKERCPECGAPVPDRRCPECGALNTVNGTPAGVNLNHSDLKQKPD